MPKYLVKAKYTAPEGVKGLLEDGGTVRVEAVSKLMASLGGKLESLYYAFGEVDAYAIFELPDNVSAAAASLAISASGEVSVEVVPLITPAEIDQAVKMSPNYDPPGPE